MSFFQNLPWIYLDFARANSGIGSITYNIFTYMPIVADFGHNVF